MNKTIVRLLLGFVCFSFGNLIYADNMTGMQALKELERVYNEMLPAKEKNEQVFSWISEIPHPLFNAVMHLRVDNLEEKLEELIDKTPEGVPLTFWIHEKSSPNLQKLVEARNFQSIIICPLMVGKTKNFNVVDYQVLLSNSQKFHDILGEVFAFSDPIRKAYAKLLNNVHTENYIIYADNQPVGTGTLIPNGEIGSVFNVSVLPEFQKKGYGRQMMEYLMNRAYEMGIKELVLLSSPVAKKLYLDLGFKVCFNIDIYSQ